MSGLRRREKPSMHSREASKRRVTTQATTQNQRKVPFSLRKLLKGMAGTTGLEPAASAVTGQRSNQLNYVPTRQNQEIPRTRLEKLAGFLWYCARCHGISAASNRLPTLALRQVYLNRKLGSPASETGRHIRSLICLGERAACDVLSCTHENSGPSFLCLVGCAST